MKQFLLLLFIAFSFNSLWATDVTFKVDMNGQANFNPAIDSLTITGSLNDWNSKANVLTDTNTDGIYEISLALAAGDVVEYKYVIVDGDGADDVWGDPVAKAAYAGTSNRAISVPEADLVLETVTFTGCSGINNGMVSVIFQVDMSTEIINSAGVYVAGDFPGKAWWTDAFAFTENNGVYLDTINLVPNFVLNYKYLNGNSWDGQETSIPDEVKYGDNRGGVVPNKVNQYYTLPVTPFNGKPTLYDVTFNIGSDDGALGKVSINVFNRNLEVMNGGDTTIALADGFYPYTVNAISYYDIENDFMVEGQTKTITETLLTANKSIHFSIADSINVAPNTSLMIKSSHPLMNADGSEITNDNVTSLLSFKMGTTDIDFFAQINEGKDEITLIPNVLLDSNITYVYGLKSDVLKYNDGEILGDTSASFTVRSYVAVLDMYQDFDGESQTTGFYTKVADDHIGASAQPYYSAVPASSSDKVLKFSKGTGSWGGWGKLQINLAKPMDLSLGKIIAFDVYSSKACKVRLALTDSLNSEGGIQVETGDNMPADVYISKVNEWQTIYVDFTEGNFVDDLAYEHLMFIFDAGVDEDNTYYIDNIRGPSLGLSTGLESVRDELKVQVYPNPAQDIINVRSEQSMSSVAMFSITGQLVFHKSGLNTKEYTIDGKGFEPGMYVVKTADDLRSASSIVIIK